MNGRVDEQMSKFIGMNRQESEQVNGKTNMERDEREGMHVSA